MIISRRNSRQRQYALLRRLFISLIIHLSDDAMACGSRNAEIYISHAAREITPRRHYYPGEYLRRQLAGPTSDLTAMAIMLRRIYFSSAPRRPFSLSAPLWRHARR